MYTNTHAYQHPNTSITWKCKYNKYTQWASWDKFSHSAYNIYLHINTFNKHWNYLLDKQCTLCKGKMWLIGLFHSNAALSMETLTLPCPRIVISSRRQLDVESSPTKNRRSMNLYLIYFWLQWICTVPLCGVWWIFT